MSKISKIFCLGVIFASIMLACVPAKEFQALQDKNLKCEDEREQFSTENESLNVRVTELDTKLKVLQAEVDKLLADSANRAVELKQLREDKERLSSRYAELQQLQTNLMQGNQQETRKVLSQLQITQKELQDKEDALKELERKLYQRKIGLDKMQTDLDKLNKELEQRNARLIELEKILHSKDSIVLALKKKVTDALYGFEGKGLSITMQNGKVYVSLEEKLMFKSGKYDVDPKGASALKQLIPVLEQNPDINILIEGHTDDVPYKGNTELLDNWDLSTKRATTILRILVNGSKINPARVTAAGRSQYVPLDKAKTPEARQKNRRTEIILTPKLDELFKILEAN
ncbi:MAG: OmpA family protein [Tenuifilaceae bacterium]